MILTNHAIKRKSQRGFSNFVMDIIYQNGNVKTFPNGEMKLSLGKKEYQKIVGDLKRAIQLMDKAKGGHIIMRDEVVLTVYKKAV